MRAETKAQLAREIRGLLQTIGKGTELIDAVPANVQRAIDGALTRALKLEKALSDETKKK